MECFLVDFTSALGDKGFYVLLNTSTFPLLQYFLSNYLKTPQLGNVARVEGNSPETLKPYKIYVFLF